MTNPLLNVHGLPRFNEILPEHVQPAIEQRLEESTAALEVLESSLTNASEVTFQDLFEPLTRLSSRVDQPWAIIQHLLSVMSSDEMREVHKKAQPSVVSFGMRVGQSLPLYKAARKLRDTSETWEQLWPWQQRMVTHLLRSAEHSGVALEGEPKQRFLAIQTEESSLSTDFSNHILDAIKAWHLDLDNAADIEGWPTSLRNQASAAWNRAFPDAKTPATPENGPWRVTLDGSVLMPFLQHHRNREQRRQVYLDNLAKASSGELDNTQIIDRLLELRKEEASLLNYDNYAALSLSSKMADVPAVRAMYDQFAEICLKESSEEFDTLAQYAKQQGLEGEIQQWDTAFYAERLREERYAYTDDEVRPYFPLNNVLEGLFKLCHTLFGISCEPAHVANTWHQDVQYYLVRDEHGAVIASFYLDPYTRPGLKRSGAWVNTCRNRHREGSLLQLPVIYIVCNSTPPSGDTPSLMSFSEVTTLFHEFGHALQGMLTEMDHQDISGLHGIEWDAIEIASQFMENWCYHEPTLMSIARHYQSGETMPRELFDKICAARTFRAASLFSRQLDFGFTDIYLHSDYDPAKDGDVFSVRKKLSCRFSPTVPLDEDRFLCSFSHIFAGGYSAGYYSYKWSEIYAADAFAAFEEAGLDSPDTMRTLGRKLRDTLLALGGSQHPLDVYRQFRGKDANADALLRHSGLA